MIEQIRTHKMNKKSLQLVRQIQEILSQYQEKGIRVTLRQLYYQLVSRAAISNNLKSYKMISGLVTNARYSGLIDWEAIEDRTRQPKIPSTFDGVDDLIDAAAASYQLDKWQEQKYYVELWTEKDAISSVILPLTSFYQVPVCVNRGYSSASSMYEAAQRFIRKIGKKCIILYLGDHDPSGLDMDRDIRTRLSEFGAVVSVVRLGLTFEQVQKYQLPPNNTKKNDTRSKPYIEQFGPESWEVDALNPEILQALIKNTILSYLDLDKFNLVQEKEKQDIEELKRRWQHE